MKTHVPSMRFLKMPESAPKALMLRQSWFITRSAAGPRPERNISVAIKELLEEAKIEGGVFM
jgi:hypothetical protein